MQQKRTRTAATLLRLTPEEKADLADAAYALRMSQNEYIVQTLARRERQEGHARRGRERAES